MTDPEETELAPFRIEEARSSRSRCRTCRRKIERGKLRLGILLEGPYGTGYLWHHLACAARRRLEDVEDAYEARAWGPDVDVPPIEELRLLEAQAEEKKRSKKDPPYAERAPSDRSRCKHCDETIPKDSFRIVLAREIRFGSQIRSMPIKVHPACVAAELLAEDCLTESDGFAETLRANTPELTEDEGIEILGVIGELG